MVKRILLILLVVSCHSTNPSKPEVFTYLDDKVSHADKDLFRSLELHDARSTEYFNQLIDGYLGSTNDPDFYRGPAQYKDSLELEDSYIVNYILTTYHLYLNDRPYDFNSYRDTTSFISIEQPHLQNLGRTHSIFGKMLGDNFDKNRTYVDKYRYSEDGVYFKTNQTLLSDRLLDSVQISFVRLRCDTNMILGDAYLTHTIRIDSVSQDSTVIKNTMVSSGDTVILHQHLIRRIR